MIAYTVISCYTKTTSRTNEFPFAIPYNHAPGQPCNFTEPNTPIPFKSLIWEISCVDCLEQVMGEEKKGRDARGKAGSIFKCTDLVWICACLPYRAVAQDGYSLEHSHYQDMSKLDHHQFPANLNSAVPVVIIEVSLLARQPH